MGKITRICKHLLLLEKNERNKKKPPNVTPSKQITSLVNKESTMPIKGVVLTLIVLLSCVACGSADSRKPAASTTTTSTTGTTQPVTVELDVYSGRPNPTWTLTVQEVAELIRRLQKLATLPTVPSVDNLGYRGFLLRNPGTVPGIGTEVRVYNGIIIIPDQGRTSAYKDSHALEQWLIAQARAHGQGDTLKAVGK
jgi:hypothetical protein